MTELVNDERETVKEYGQGEKKAGTNEAMNQVFVLMLKDYLQEKRSSRRWSYVKWVVFLIVFFLLTYSFFFRSTQGIAIGNEIAEHTALISLTGTIENDGDISALSVSKSLDMAFKNVNSVGVILRINSPGGSPVQSSLIHNEIQRLKKEFPEKKIVAVVEDVAASGGYFIAAATDQIFVNKSSLVGSIGVVYNGFGFVDLLKQIGVERRLMVSGEKKVLLDPFLPSGEKAKNMMQEIMDDLHKHFIDAVKSGRGSTLLDDPDIFSGRVFTGEESLDLGLSDDYGSVRSVAEDFFGQPLLIHYADEENLLEKLKNNLVNVGIETVKSYVKDSTDLIQIR